MQQLLDDPNLKKLEQTGLKGASLALRGRVTNLAISRGRDQAQHLLFADEVRATGAGGKPVAVSGTSNSLIRPLEKWIKTEILSTKTAPTNGITATRCTTQ